MQLKPSYRWIIGAVALVSLCFGLGWVAMRAEQTAAQAPQTATPFTLQTQIISLAHGGEVHRKQTIAVRSDGSRSVTETILGAIGLRAGEIKRSIRFADGRSITIFPSISIKNTWPVLSQAATKQALARVLNPPEDRVYPGWTLVQHDMIQGQDVAVVSHTSKEVGWKITAWRAPQLGCETLKYISYDRDPDGNLVAHTQLNMVALQLGEPDPGLFDEAPSYREATPTEVGQIIAQKYHLVLGNEANSWLEQFDKTYSGSQASGTR